SEDPEAALRFGVGVNTADAGGDRTGPFGDAGTCSPDRSRSAREVAHARDRQHPSRVPGFCVRALSALSLRSLAGMQWTFRAKTPSPAKTQSTPYVQAPLTLQHSLGHRQIARMTKRQVNSARSDLTHSFKRSPVELNRRRTGQLVDHFDILPPDAVRPTGAKRLHHRFLCRKPSGITGKLRWTRPPLAVTYLAISEDARTKTLSSTRQHPFEPRNLNQVDANSDNHSLKPVSPSNLRQVSFQKRSHAPLQATQSDPDSEC